jgi:hypothetical protein
LTILPRGAFSPLAKTRFDGGAVDRFGDRDAAHSGEHGARVRLREIRGRGAPSGLGRSEIRDVGFRRAVTTVATGSARMSERERGWT